MRAIDKMVEWLESKARASVLIKDYWLEAAEKARRLAAEEKSGDEGLREAFIEYLNKHCPPIAHYSLTPEEQQFFNGVESVQKAIGHILRSHLTPKEAPEGLVEKINYMWSKVRGGGPSGGGNPRPCYDCVKELKSLADRPTPSRTGELVKRLRELIDRRYTNGVRGGWGDDIEEILRDFEGGA